jgi:hypothetical protein
VSSFSIHFHDLALAILTLALCDFGNQVYRVAIGTINLCRRGPIRAVDQWMNVERVAIPTPVDCLVVVFYLDTGGYCLRAAIADQGAGWFRQTANLSAYCGDLSGRFQNTVDCILNFLVVV